MRRTSLTAGVLYLITFVSMPTLAVYQPVREQADFVLGAGSDTAPRTGEEQLGERGAAVS